MDKAAAPPRQRLETKTGNLSHRPGQRRKRDTRVVVGKLQLMGNLAKYALPALEEKACALLRQGFPHETFELGPQVRIKRPRRPLGSWPRMFAPLCTARRLGLHFVTVPLGLRGAADGCEDPRERACAAGFSRRGRTSVFG